MPGLDPGIHGLQHEDMREGGGWVYVMTNRPNDTLYLGVTSDIARRAWEHREGLVEGFTKRYDLTRLVCVERHEEIATAIQRERTLKHWPRLEGQTHPQTEPQLGRSLRNPAVALRGDVDARIKSGHDEFGSGRGGFRLGDAACRLLRPRL